MKPIEVKALRNYQLNVVFDDGVSGVIDLKDFIKRGVFAPLQDAQLFKKVYITHSSIAWSEELEIDALNVYAEILKKQPSEIVHSSLQHASD